MNHPDPHPLDAVSSPDLNAERLATLKKLFPDLFSNEGRLNVDELKKVVDPALVSETERYDFRWYGKTMSKREAFTPSRAALVHDPARSVNPDQAGGNIIIEGENLEVLKLLTCSYRERIKCIYIDPPYNTGKDFVYSDNFAEGQKPYWEQTGVTENGVKVDTNTQSDGRYHSNWLCMMHSRLLVARYLLADDGLMFVSIADHEVCNLRKLMNDVFGEENFMALFVWKSGAFPDSRAKTGVSVDHEHIIAYSKTEESVLRGVERDESKFSNPDADPRGPWMSRSLLGLATREQRPNLHFPIADQKSGSTFEPPPNTGWRYNRERMEKLIADKEEAFERQLMRLPEERRRILDEVLLKNGFMLDYTVTPQPEFTKNEVLLAKDAHKESLICLDGKIEPETIDHFKTHKDRFFICLEYALDTTKKWNLKHNLGEKLKAI